MEKILDDITEPEKEGLHPAFSQCLPVFILPFGMFLLLFFGARQFYVVFVFLYLEIFFYFLIQWFRRSTQYIFWPDRIEVRTGLFRSTSKAIPFDEITEIACNQSLYQMIFKIGDITIETAGGKETFLCLAGIKFPKQITKALFAMKKGGAA